MKLIISLVLILTSAIALGQNSAKASLVREVDEYVKTANNAAGKFLNNKLYEKNNSLINDYIGWSNAVTWRT